MQGFWVTQCVVRKGGMCDSSPAESWGAKLSLHLPVSFVGWDCQHSVPRTHWTLVFAGIQVFCGFILLVETGCKADLELTV